MAYTYTDHPTRGRRFVRHLRDLGHSMSQSRSVTRRTFLEASAALAAVPLVAPTPRVFQATGFKLSEPTSTSVVVWTRVTRNAERAPDTAPLPMVTLLDRETGAVVQIQENRTYPNARPVVGFAAGTDWSSIAGAAAGAPGQTRVRYRPTGGRWQQTDWRSVDPSKDFTALVALEGLRPGTRYDVIVEARGGSDAADVDAVPGGFTTAPEATANARVSFAVMSCQEYDHRDRPDGFEIYPSMLNTRPDFFVNTGDAVYYDHGAIPAVTLELARYHWARMFGYGTLRQFHTQVGSYFMKDDHDTLADDTWPGSRSGEFSFEDGLRVFHEQTALTSSEYRTVRWGRHLQVWMVEGRNFRTRRPGEDRTIWGPKQLAWVERTMKGSDATFKVLITQTPIVGPDRPSKNDNYANAGFAKEGAAIRRFLHEQPNLFVVTGDRHWQYVSVDPATQLEEWSVGAASDAHAGGWNESTPRAEHRFLRIDGGGFLSGEVRPTTRGAALILRLHDTAGRVVFEETKTAAGR